MVLSSSELYKIYSLVKIGHWNIVLLWFEDFLVHLYLGMESVTSLRREGIAWLLHNVSLLFPLCLFHSIPWFSFKILKSAEWMPPPCAPHFAIAISDFISPWLCRMTALRLPFGATDLWTKGVRWHPHAHLCHLPSAGPDTVLGLWSKGRQKTRRNR